MKVEMEWNGMLRISAETELEAFALSRWVGEAGIIFNPLATCACGGRESMAFKGSRVFVDATYRVPDA